MKTLIVDDSDSVLEKMKTMLNSLGVQDVATASNGLQAVGLYKDSVLNGAPFKLVFLDIVMPVMDGQGALKMIRTFEKSVNMADDDKAVIIMTTALNSPEDMIESLVQGDCTDYIVKPVDLGSLRGMLLKYKVD